MQLYLRGFMHKMQVARSIHLYVLTDRVNISKYNSLLLNGRAS